MKEVYQYVLKPLMVIAIATAAIVASVYCCGGNPSETRDTVTVVRVDTLRDTIKSVKPIAKDSTIVRYIQVPVIISDTIIETKEVLLPVEQKMYEDSTYTAWVSGVYPCLDSIEVYRKTVNVYTDRTITVTKQAPRLSFGLTGGVGIVGDFKVDYVRPGWFVGIGLNYRLGK